MNEFNQTNKTLSNNIVENIDNNCNKLFNKLSIIVSSKNNHSEKNDSGAETNLKRKSILIKNKDINLNNNRKLNYINFIFNNYYKGKNNDNISEKIENIQVFKNKFIRQRN